MTTAKRYFAAPLPHLFAHRGLHEHVPENTLEAFKAALGAGASHLETDVHATADGIVVLHHDGEFESDGELIQVHELTLDELRTRADAAGFSIPTLVEALKTFPSALFNIDVKSETAIGPTIEALKSEAAQDRVCIASFSAKRRGVVVAAMPGIATSASRREVLWSWIACSMGLTGLTGYILRDVDAVQVPASVGPFPLVTARYVRACHRASVFVDVWTINDPIEMTRLVSLGADGIVTDRVDLAVEALDRQDS